ncbi:M15 family metallopeptidase [Gottfriedia acidiceleris]|uniref:M15 family metallopeptidase n=1 Tax=Gottfriedia acidiceleris TaxID=371036 RepID=UPI00111C07F5|nr:M15 family metallopeptidase [Gottfriedia acidiceleris]
MSRSEKNRRKKPIIGIAISLVLVAGVAGTLYEKNKEPNTIVIKKNAKVKTDIVKNDNVLNFPDYYKTTKEDESGLLEVLNVDSNLVLVNKDRKLPDGYEPNDLIYPSIKLNGAVKEKTRMRSEAGHALEKLFAGASSDGYTLTAISGYRSYDRQVSLYNNYISTHGEEWTKAYSALPGTSEHQTGLAIDVSSPSFGNALEVDFAKTPEGKWLAEHAHEYGFIIRYPEDKVDITNYHYEPWHIRYVGKEYATYLYTHHLALEEAMPAKK